MPLLSPVGTEILIACVTIVWGILVETWYVSRWTIFFNIVPMIAMMGTFEQSGEVLWLMGGFLAVSFLLISVSGWQWLKQLIGAKGYGVVALCFGLVDANMITPSGFLATLGMVSLVVGFCWFVVYAIKDQYG